MADQTPDPTFNPATALEVDIPGPRDDEDVETEVVAQATPPGLTLLSPQDDPAPTATFS